MSLFVAFSLSLSLSNEHCWLPPDLDLKSRRERFAAGERCTVVLHNNFPIQNLNHRKRLYYQSNRLRTWLLLTANFGGQTGRRTWKCHNVLFLGLALRTGFRLWVKTMVYLCEHFGLRFFGLCSVALPIWNCRLLIRLSGSAEVHLNQKSRAFPFRPSNDLNRRARSLCPIITHRNGLELLA